MNGYRSRIVPHNLIEATVILASILAGIVLLVKLFPSSMPPIQEVSDLALVANLGFLSYQIILGRGERRNATYQNLMSRFSEATLFLAEHPRIAKLFYDRDCQPLTWDYRTSPEEVALYAYFETLLGLFEAVWVGEREMGFARRYMDAWRHWLGDIINHPVMRQACNVNLQKKLLDELFGRDLRSMLN